VTADTADWLALLDEIADQTDRIALARFGQADLQIDIKMDRSPVTGADLAIEQMARRLAAAQDPGLGVYGEEEGETSVGSRVRLIIDPIDATQNFIRGIPIFATLLAIEIAGEVIAGVVSAPALRARWRAAKGKGAYRGSQPIAVSNISDLADAQVLHGDIGGSVEPTPPSGLFSLAKMAKRTRGFGDFYQHVLVAEGAAECAVDPGVSPWDIAALQILVEEAGGRATSLTGERTIYGGSLITTNGRLHNEVLSYIRQA
jgi:histidinol-phosphatase